MLSFKDKSFKDKNALVAQLDRVLGYEPSGRRFESSRVHHIIKTSLFSGVFLCGDFDFLWLANVCDSS